MNKPRLRSHHLHRARAAALLLGASGLVLGTAACDSGDRVQEELTNITATLDGLGTSAVPHPIEPYRVKVYNDALTRLRGLGDGLLPGQAAAANLLASMAHAGLAKTTRESAGPAEADLANTESLIRATLEQFLSQHSAADALASYNPQPEIDDLAAQTAARTDELAAVTAARDRQAAIVEELDTQAAAAVAAERAGRDEESQVRQGAVRASETTRAAIVEQARVIKRRADEFEKAATGFKARADKERPRLEELTKQVERVQTQLQLLETARLAARKRGEDARAQSESARAEARQTGARVIELTSQLDTQLAALLSPLDDALKGYQQSAGAAKKASAGVSRDSKAAAELASAAAQQGVGDLAARKADALAAVRDVYARLTEVRSALPGAERFDARIAELGADLEAAREQARTAYDEAKGLFDRGSSGGGGGVSGEQFKAGIDQIVASMQSFAERHGAQPPAAEPPAVDEAPSNSTQADSSATPGQAEAPESAAAAPGPGVEAEVREFAARMLEAAKARDAGGLQDMIVADGADAEAILSKIWGIDVHVRALDDACQSAYGQPFQQLVQSSTLPSVKGNPMLIGMRSMNSSGVFGSDPDALSELTPDALTVTVVSDNEALLTAPGVDQPLTVKKIDGQWKGLFSIPPDMAPMAKMIGPMVDAASGAMQAIVPDINAGKYDTADKMLLAFSGKLMAAMQKAAGLPGAPGRPPPAGEQPAEDPEEVPPGDGPGGG